MDKKRVVVVFRDILLPPSETFVLNQSEALENYTPYYVGTELMEGGLLLPMDRTLTVDADWRGVPVLSQGVQEVGRLNPVLIHAHNGVCGAQILPLTRALKVPLVVTFRGIDATMQDEHLWSLSPKAQVYVRRKEVLKRRAALFIAVSKSIRAKLLEQGFPPTKIVVHYNGVDTKVFQPNPAVPREPVVLFVGRLVEKKGCEYLIRAMGKVQTIMPKAELVVIGDGPLGSSLKRLAKEKLHRYRFLGVQPPNVVRSWMNRAHLLCAPSITASSGDSEGMPNVVVEAQAMGVPVVGTFHSGIPEAVAHGKTGFLTAERDWEGLAEHILLLQKNDALWHRFSLAGQSRMRALFDLNKQ